MTDETDDPDGERETIIPERPERLTIRTGNMTFVVDCPYCDREESFQHTKTGFAWIVGHLQCSHGAELPSYIGDGSESDGEGDEG